jgi:hypothetical protein
MRIGIIVAIVCLTVGVGAATASAKAKHCGRIPVPGLQYGSRLPHAKVRVVRGEGTCRYARKLIAAGYRTALQNDSRIDPITGFPWPVEGWKCLFLGAEIRCTKSNRRIDGSTNSRGWGF